MRLASLLLILCLVTTCTVSGTYAKYISSDSGKDEARVAKFGVVAKVSGDLFGPSYAAKDDNNIQTWAQTKETVSACDAATTKVVAPGTKGGIMEFNVTGNPEVSTKVKFGTYLNADGTDAKLYAAEPQLVAGTYGVMVPYTGTITKDTITNYYTLASGVFTKVATAAEPASGTTYYELQDSTGAIAAPYFPITWSYSIEGGTAVLTNSLATATAAIEAEFNGTGTNPGKSFKPNEGVALSALAATLTWDWFFEGGLDDTANTAPAATTIYSEQDKADTILGDMIALASDKLNTDSYVVKLNGENYDQVKITTIKIMSDSADANTVTVAYTGATVPTVAYSAELTTLSSGVCAVLGAAFDASLTVTQID